MWFYLLAVYILLNITTTTEVMEHNIFIPLNFTYKVPSISIHLACWKAGSKIYIVRPLFFCFFFFLTGNRKKEGGWNYTLMFLYRDSEF